MTERSSATWPRSDSATPTIAAPPRSSPSITRPPSERRPDKAAPRRQADDAEAHALPDAHLFGRDVLHPAHQAEAFIAVDQRHVERLALRRMHDGRGVDRSQPLADPPFQPRAAGERTDDAGIE